MKKLLGILSSISILSSTSGVAVSCSSGSRIDTPTLDVKKAMKIIAQLSANTGQSDKNFDFTFSDLLSDADVTTALVNEIDRLVSLNWDYDKTNEMLSTGPGLNLGQYGNDQESMDAFEERFNNLIQTVAEDKLYNEFSKSVIDGSSSSLDHSLSKQYYSFNPINDTEIIGIDKTVHKIKKGTVIKFGTDKKTWQLYEENASSSDKASHIPDLDDLTTEYKEGSNGNFFVTDENDKEVAISAKTALSLRFQDYFNTEKESIIDNALTMVYNQSSMWRIQELLNGQTEDAINGSGKVPVKMPYIDITNPVFSKTQSWDSSDFYTNVKMVWTYTVSKDDYNSKITNIKSQLGIDANGHLTSSKEGISDLFSKLNTTFTTNLDKKDGVDPYFGLSGYKGVVISQNGTAVGDNPISGAAYESYVNDENNLKNHGGITIQNASLPYFVNSDNSNNYDIVITLPVYMMQLLGVDYANNSNDETSDYIYSISGSDESHKKQIQFQRSPDSSTSFRDLWIDNDQDESPDVDKIVTDSVKQKSLIQQIEYLVSQESNNASNAKKAVYSKYLDADDIYYAGLFDQIGTYISSDNEEDE